MKTKFAIAGVLVSVGAFVALFHSGFHASGQPTGDKVNPEEASIRATIGMYTAALKNGDLKGILAFWTADADFVDVAGEHHKGKDAIGKLFEQNLKDLQQGKSTIKVDTIRFLSGDVAVLHGAVEFTHAGGDVEHNRFSSTWVKRGGNWLIASVRDLPEAAAEAGERGMKALQFLVGDWTAEEKTVSVKLNVKLGMGEKFAFMNYDIKKGKESLNVLQIVGYDPVDGALRSWTFDSRGGFGDGLWVKDGNVWIGDMVGVLPTGQVGSATHSIRVDGPNAITFQSFNREVDGQAVPDHELKYTRVAAK